MIIITFPGCCVAQQKSVCEAYTRLRVHHTRTHTHTLMTTPAKSGSPHMDSECFLGPGSPVIHALLSRPWLLSFLVNLTPTVALSPFLFPQAPEQRCLTSWTPEGTQARPPARESSPLPCGSPGASTSWATRCLERALPSQYLHRDRASQPPPLLCTRLPCASVHAGPVSGRWCCRLRFIY